MVDASSWQVGREEIPLEVQKNEEVEHQTLEVAVDADVVAVVQILA